MTKYLYTCIISSNYKSDKMFFLIVGFLGNNEIICPNGLTCQISALVTIFAQSEHISTGLHFFPGYFSKRLWMLYSS